MVNVETIPIAAPVQCTRDQNNVHVTILDKEKKRNIVKQTKAQGQSAQTESSCSTFNVINDHDTKQNMEKKHGAGYKSEHALSREDNPHSVSLHLVSRRSESIIVGDLGESDPHRYLIL